jgi:5-methylcytosine-specific restriction endonuclease McrA
LTFRIPSIIRLKTYVNTKKNPPIRFSRENIYIRDEHCCQYCKVRFHAKDLTLDHVVPVSLGGKKEWTNIVTACRACNQRKSNRTPVEAKMPLLKKPGVPRWLPQPDLRVTTISAPESWRMYLQFEAG